MEGIQKAIRDISKDIKFPNPKSSSSSSSTTSSSSSSSWERLTEERRAPPLTDAESQILLARNSRQAVSVWTCSKLCAIFFVAGVFVGYTLKRRVRKWASKLLRRLKDD